MNSGAEGTLIIDDFGDDDHCGNSCHGGHLDDDGDPDDGDYGDCVHCECCCGCPSCVYADRSGDVGFGASRG